jgi:inosine-uridine nucleoside N-ribohydrolase
MDRNLVYVDTDISLGTPGAEIDDGAAIIFLLRQKSLEVAASGSVFGNVCLQDATMNLSRLLTWLDYDRIPLGIGAEKPLVADMNWFEDWRSEYGTTLPWHIPSSTLLAANAIIQTIHTNPGKVSILSLGPMTNLALAVRLDPSIVLLTREVVVMGGSFNIQDPAPEFNVRCDPEAAQIIISAGWNVHILGLDITRRVHFSRQDFSSLPDSNPAVELLRSQAPSWIDRMEAMGWEQNGCALHDAVAAAYLVDDSMFRTEDMNIQVELLDPHHRGLTRFEPKTTGESAVRVVTALKPKKCRELILSHLQI